MVRKLVAMYLVTVTLAGPSICCCRVSRFFSQSHHQSCHPASAHGSGPQSGCCCHCHRANLSVENESSETRCCGEGGQPQPTKSRCPCGKHSDQIFAVSNDNEGGSGFIERDLNCFPPKQFHGGLMSANQIHFLSESGIGFGWDQRFLGANDLLYAHHILRC